MSTTQKNQHYVWKHYLEAWTVEKQVWCVRAPQTVAFSANPSKVASETFFYRLQELDDLDLQFVEGIISQATSPGLRDVNSGWLKYFQYTFRVRKAMGARRAGTPDRAKLNAALDRVEKTISETYMSAVENRAIPILKALRSCDFSISDDAATFMTFAEFISHQYWRTAKMRNAMLALQHLVSHRIERTWPIERFVYATNMASSMIGERQRYGLVFLQNATNKPFIAGDQPVINLNGHNDGTLRLYYPLSPALAVIYAAKTDERLPDARIVEAAEVEALNLHIHAKSDSQIYSDDRSYLELLARSDKQTSAA